MIHTDRKLMVALLVVSVLLTIAISVSSHPLVSSGRGQSNGSNGMPVAEQNTASGKRASICTSKGRMCEALCKNNPQAGGKVCNCDNYVLSNRDNRAYQGRHEGLI